MPDAELEEFVDRFADAELAAGLTACIATAGRSEHLPFVQTLFQQGLQQPDGIELGLGTAIGRLRQESHSTDQQAQSACSTTRAPRAGGQHDVRCRRCCPL